MKEKVYRQIKEKVQQQRNANGESVSNTMETLLTAKASTGMHKQHRPNHYPNTRSQTTHIATQNTTATARHKTQNTCKDSNTRQNTIQNTIHRHTCSEQKRSQIYCRRKREKHKIFFSKKVRKCPKTAMTAKTNTTTITNTTTATAKETIEH